MDLKTLKLANVGLKSKGLAIMCLGLARNNTLSELDLNYNEIGNFIINILLLVSYSLFFIFLLTQFIYNMTDESGFKTLALILRHTKSLQSMKILRKKKIVTTSMGEEKEAEDELGYNAMAAFTKAFKHNKFLDPTNILIFESK